MFIRLVRRLAALLLGLTWIIGYAPASANAAGNAAVEDACGGVVRIYVEYTYRGEEYGASGTGFFVGGAGDEQVEYIITNAHVVEIGDGYGNFSGEHVPRAAVIFDSAYASSTAQAEVIYCSQSEDMAVLRLSQPTALRRGLPLRSSRDVIRTEEVYALGFPGVADDSQDLPSTVEDVTVTKGTISKSKFSYEGASYLQVDAALNSGNSGGPLIDADGNVVGINSMTSVAGENTNYALYIDYAMDWLSSNGVAFEAASQGGTEDAQPSAAGTEQTSGSAPEQPAASPAAPEETPAQEAGAPGKTGTLSTGGKIGLICAASAAVFCVVFFSVRAAQNRKTRREGEKQAFSSPAGPPGPPSAANAGAIRAPSAPPPGYGMNGRVPPGMGETDSSSPSGQSGAAPLGKDGGPPPAPSSSPGKAWALLAIGADNPLAGRTFPIRGDTMIGRKGRECAIAYPEDARGVSRTHCCVRPSPQGLVVIDMNSSYGTFLDGGQRMNPGQGYALKPGERFYLATGKNGFELR